MKSVVIYSSLITLLVFTSCKKNYTCVCTNTNTGAVSHGDVIKATPITKNAWETDCKQNATLSNGTLKDCHLENA